MTKKVTFLTPKVVGVYLYSHIFTQKITQKSLKKRQKNHPKIDKNHPKIPKTLKIPKNTFLTLFSPTLCKFGKPPKTPQKTPKTPKCSKNTPKKTPPKVLKK